jgi:hypothetical protein
MFLHKKKIKIISSLAYQKKQKYTKNPLSSEKGFFDIFPEKYLSLEIGCLTTEPGIDRLNDDKPQQGHDNTHDRILHRGLALIDTIVVSGGRQI